MFAGKKSAQIREILISESAWEEMTCLFAPSLDIVRFPNEALQRRRVNTVLLSYRLTPINLRMKPRHPLLAWLLISYHLMPFLSSFGTVLFFGISLFVNCCSSIKFLMIFSSL
ncbi:hypothetical protein ZR21_19745 [Salmonella enterica subsp. enterica serovar Muenchen]|nr:hypothetical protein [Salmonella enterica subsp. enterica serovar Muenchen]